jgi:DNA-binding transcriptional MerR regulator
MASVIGTVVGFLGVLSPMGGAIMAATGGFEGSGEKIKEWARKVGVSIGEAVAKVAAGAVEMVAAISRMAGEFFSAGVAAVTGLIKGIGSMIDKAVDKAKELAQSVISAVKGIGGFIINSPSIPMIEVGESVGEGLDKGLKNSIPGSEKAVKDLAQATLSAGKGEFANTTIYSEEDVLQLQQLREEYKELGKVLKDLKAQKEDLGLKGDAEGQAALNNEIEMVKQRRKELNVQKKQVETGKEANDEADEAAKQQAKYINAAIGAGTDFALANANQFASDLGIGGSGAISQGVDQGISFLTSSISKLVSSGLGGTGGNIVVNNVDDAVAAKQNQTNVQKKRYANR